MLELLPVIKIAVMETSKLLISFSVLNYVLSNAINNTQTRQL